MFQENSKLVLANGIELVYETFGNPDAPPVLLIMGLGNQMIDWREEFCEMVASRGYWVIRFDNRDAGKSQKFHQAGTPSVFEIASQVAIGDSPPVPYSMEDMAADCVGLMDELKIDKAHVVGLSMGGMIAQTVAINYPSRLITLTSIMSAPRYMLPASREALELLTKPTPASREEYIRYAWENSMVLGGSKYKQDEALYCEHAGRRFDRGLCPPGFARQLCAVMTQGDRREALNSVGVPTLVLHGTSDPLVPVEGGKETAESIPNAKLKLIDGWGHGFPPVLWPTIVDELTNHFEKG